MRRINLKRERAITMSLLLGMSLIGLSLQLAHPPVSTATTTLTVNSTADDGTGTCSVVKCTLRDVVLSAAPGDTITFSLPANSTIALTNSELSINKNLTISGPGANLLTVQRSTAGGTPQFRIATVSLGTTVSISGLTLSNGSVSGAIGGGAIYNDRGTLTVTSCVFSQNSAESGGAIYNSGSFGAPTLTIINSTFIQNSAITGLAQGGAILSIASTGTANTSVANSTFSQNSASEGGAIFNATNNASATANLTVVNSTFDQNSGNADGGGLVNAGNSGGTANAKVINTTFSQNSAPAGGGIFNFINSGTATLQIGNTIFKTGATGANLLSNGTVTSLGHNLCDDSAEGGAGTGPGGDLNQPGDQRNTDPLLGPLANNGGSTQTHLLLLGSPAIDAGSNALAVDQNSNPLTTDQRDIGFPRVINSTVDIGAVEANYGISATSGTPQSTTINTAFASQLQATVTESGNPQSGFTVTFTAPASGASGTFPGSTTTATAVTNGSGVATAPVFTANGTVGSFNVVASFGIGLPTTTFALTNLKINQTITVNTHAPASAVHNTSFIVSATASSGLPVSFSSSGVCTNVGATFTMTSGTGTCTVKYDQGGDGNFSAAPQVTESVTAQKANQSITVNTHAPASAVHNTSFTVSATANSGLPVSFSSSGVCTNVGATFTMTSGTGTCTVKYDQAGDSNFSAAPQVTESVTAQKANQTITFGALANKTFGDADFTVSATASSGLAVSFLASGQCTVTGTTVHLTAAGSCTITAGQAGNADFNAATDVPRTFTIANAPTTTAVVSSQNPSVINQNVTFTATVSSTVAGTPTGTVQFKDGAANLGAAQTLNATRQASISTTTLTAGSHGITAVYSGDAFYAASIGTLSGGQVVNDKAIFSFSQSSYNSSETAGFVTITVNRTGLTTPAVTVDYATDDTGALSNCSQTNGLASSRCDFTTAIGTLQFAAGEIQKTFVVLVNRDSYLEGPESFTVNLSNPTGAAILGAPSTATVTIADDSSGLPPNAIDDTQFFVQQHYHDFLNREPDAPGLNFWTNQITSCGADAQCIETKRINVSAAFFLSIEFQQTGYFVERTYKVSFGDVAGTSTLNGAHTLPVPIVRFNEFLHDTQEIGLGVVVGQGNWQQQLENNKQAYTGEFVQRSRFTTAFPNSLTPAQFVDKLFTNAGVTPSASDRTAAINEFGAAATSSDPAARARALRDVTENSTLTQQETNRAFVLMEYLGYLRRNPNDSPDSDYTGFDFWLIKLNQFNGNFINAEMVKAFIASGEYRHRFGP